MLKFIRSKGNQQLSAERQKLQKELYAFRKVSKTMPREIISKFIKHTKIFISFTFQNTMYVPFYINVETHNYFSLISKKKYFTPFGKIK